MNACWCVGWCNDVQAVANSGVFGIVDLLDEIWIGALGQDPILHCLRHWIFEFIVAEARKRNQSGDVVVESFDGGEGGEIPDDPRHLSGQDGYLASPSECGLDVGVRCFGVDAR